jgi:putative inorganic carbon (hco3(-)) transporter
MFARLIRWSFYSLVFIVPLIFLPNTTELFEFNKLIVTWILTTFIVAAWVARMLAEKRWIFKRTALDWPLIIFLLVTLLSTLFSIDRHVSWFGYYSRWNGGFLSLFSYALLYWSFVSNMDSNSTRKLINFSLVSASLVAFYGVLEHFGIDKHIWVQDVQNRVFSTIGQPNWLAAYLVALIWIPVSTFNTKFEIRNLKSVLNLVLFVLLFVTLLFTKSRSGILAFGISAAFYWGYIFFTTKTKLLMPMVILGGLILGMFVFVSNPIRDLVFKTTTQVLPNTGAGTQLDTGGTESGNIRKIVWTGAIRIWQGNTKNLLLGSGPETFAQSYYQYRPLEHNMTSEWELLYNKAHNEFLNQLATTGIIGLGSYILLLAAMIYVLIRELKSHSANLFILSLLAGWLTFPVTNFWGFSVVVVQILMFILPAIAVTSNEPESKTIEEFNWPHLLIFIPAIFIIYSVLRYWYADTRLAEGQKDIKYFQATQNAQYLMLAHQQTIQAYQLNSAEPVIASELSNTAAYLSLANLQQSTPAAQQLAEISIAASDKALNTSPRHPNYYKSRARSLILLSDLSPKYLELAAQTLEQAILISPTDPRLPFNLGVIYKYLGRDEEAKVMFLKSLNLKADFGEPQKQLTEMATSSAKLQK